MTTEEINSAIQSALGWTRKDGVADYDGMKMPWTIWTKGNERMGGDVAPNYCSDLNEMHKEEKTLTIDDFARYENELCKAVDASGADSDLWFYVLTATARRRAEAFLRAIGKWKE